MGQEIVYCSFCQTRLTGSDFQKGLAFRSGFRISCRDCRPQLPPEELRPARPPRKGSSTHIPPVVLRASRAGRQVWPFALAGAVALLVALLAAFSSARPARVAVHPKPEPSRESPPPLVAASFVRKSPPMENGVRDAKRPEPLEPLPPGLELWLRFDGTPAQDSSGRGNAGLLVGEAQILDQALGVDRDGHVRVSDAPHLRFRADQSFTVAAWVRASGRRGGYQGIVTKSRDRKPHYGLWTGHGKWVFGGSQQNIEAGSVETGWQHVAGVQDGPAGRRTLYLDGVPIGSAGAQPGDGPGELRVGSTAGPTEYFGGLIDDVRIYSRALPPEEVALLHRRGREGASRSE